MYQNNSIKKCIVGTLMVITFFTIVQIGTNIARANEKKINYGGSDGYHQLKINKGVK